MPASIEGKLPESRVTTEGYPDVPLYCPPGKLTRLILIRTNLSGEAENLHTAWKDGEKDSLLLRINPGGPKPDAQALNR